MNVTAGRSPRALVATGLLAGGLANYWILESVVAERSDPAAAWVSDLGARSESSGLFFSVLDSASGVALCALTVLLWRRRAPVSGTLRWGLIALGVTAVGAVLDGALPLSCAESLGSPCELRYDALDVAHGAESSITIVSTLAGFGLLSRWVERDPVLRPLGSAMIVMGVTWALLYLVIGMKYVIPALDDAKGSLQRAAQIVFGVWVAVLAVGVAREPEGSL